MVRKRPNERVAYVLKDLNLDLTNKVPNNIFSQAYSEVDITKKYAN